MFSFLPKTGGFGLEIGSDAIRVCAVSGRGTFAIESIAELPLKRSPWLKNGLRHKDELAEQIQGLVTQAKPHVITTNQAVAALPESAVFSKLIHLPKLSKREEAQTIPFEAAEFLPLPLEEVYLDWQINRSSTNSPEKTTSQAFVIAASQKVVDDFVTVAESANLHLVNLESQSFSLLRSVKHLVPPRSTALIVHIEAQQTLLILANKRGIKFTSSVPTGVTALDRSLESGVFVTIGDGITQSINYYHNRLGEKEEVETLLITGPGALTPNTAEKLGELTKLHCEIGYAPVKLPNNLPVHPRFNAVIGLALLGRV